MKSNIFFDYVKKIKELLNEDVNFSFGSPKKYILYLQYLKKEFANLEEDKLNELLISLYDLYSIPKKKNNFYLIFLLYFYLNYRDKIEEKIIFDTIYFYYIIIVYRNRLPLDIRQKIINIDIIKFESLHKIIENKFLLFFIKTNKILIKYKVYYILLFLFISILSVYISPYILNADINSMEFSTKDVQSTVLNSMIFFTPSQDYLNNMLGKSNSSTYFLWILLIIFSLQVFRDVIKNTIINDNLQYIIGIFKKILHIIFYIYNQFITFFTTKFILYIIDFILRFNIKLSFLFLMLFMVFYFFLYVLIVSFYMFIFSYIFNIWFVLNHFLLISSISSIILIWLNIVNDYKNFEKFFIWLNTFLDFTNKK